MARSDQEKARYASSYIQGVSTHMSMNNHMYNVDPHVSTQHYADACAVKKSNVLDAVMKRPTASRWLYDNNFPAKGSLAFPAMKCPDRSNASGRQHFLSFNSSQDQTPVEKVNDAYQIIHARGHDNAVLGGTALNRNSPANFLTDHSGSGMKVFPFLAQEALTVRVHQIPTTSGQALTPSPVAVGSSTSIKPSGTQLTIFYAGKVNVYNDVPSIKAQEIMLMAAAGDYLTPNIDMFSRKSISMVIPPVARSLINADPPELSPINLPTCQSDQLARDRVGTGLLPASIPQAPQAKESSMTGTQGAYLDNEPVVPRALPQARKASLARFLEKRKERMLSKSPYPVEKTFL